VILAAAIMNNVLLAKKQECDDVSVMRATKLLL
jgi:hypothetical protein